MQLNLSLQLGNSGCCEQAKPAMPLAQQLGRLMAAMRNTMGQCSGNTPFSPRSQFGECCNNNGGYNPGLEGFCGGGSQAFSRYGGHSNGGCCPPPHCHQNGDAIHGCQNQGGQLQQDEKGQPINYTTSGGYQVTVDKDKVTVKDSDGNDVTHSGDPHEHLNGTHLKDWEGKQRTMVLDDGTKITMAADGPQGVTQHTAIYDGNQNVQINNNSNEIEHYSRNGRDTQYRERSEYDGETSRFTTDDNGSALYYNIYNQDENYQFERDFRMLGVSQGAGSTNVTDMYPGL